MCELNLACHIFNFVGAENARRILEFDNLLKRVPRKYQTFDATKANSFKNAVENARKLKQAAFRHKRPKKTLIYALDAIQDVCSYYD